MRVQNASINNLIFSLSNNNHNDTNNENTTRKTKDFINFLFFINSDQKFTIMHL